ncbi:MAG: long-chain fatty acid--CoA ligase [Fluviicola sp.]|nr:long-chain fatty acid--CoA ligase [Fluviicola sp.]
MNQITRLFDIPYYQLERYPNDNMFVTKTAGSWVSMSTATFLTKANEMSLALLALGIEKGERVALISTNRVEWNVMDIALQQIGAIVVPLYPTISSEDYKYIFNDAAMRYAFVGNSEILERLNAVKLDIPSLLTIFSFDQLPDATYYLDLIEAGKSIDSSRVNELKANVQNEDLVTIIYTSGTTGNPKGVMLSHNNLLSNVLATEPIIPANEKSPVLTFLPICHVYERMLHYLYMRVGASVYFAESMDTIGDNIREVKPEVFSAVPRLIEKVFDRIMAKGEELKGLKRTLFFWAVKLAESYDFEGKSYWYQFQLFVARKLIFSKWKAALGGNVRAIASGSAALQPRLARIFFAAQIPILEGYGLTETSPVVSVNCLKNGVKFGTVGLLIAGVRVKIADDGEILVKGPNVMLGYYNNQTATDEVMDEEGWFKTGDIGELEKGTFLKITDRKKEIFKTSGGKYIIPQVMENKFKESRFIEQVMIVGESQKFPAALIVPNIHFIKEWAERKAIDFSTDTAEAIVSDPKVVARIEREINTLNAGFGNWEQVKRFALLPNEFSINSGELTPTLKLKRKFITQKYQEIITGFYSAE